jgi:hypothetical protein
MCDRLHRQKGLITHLQSGGINNVNIVLVNGGDIAFPLERGVIEGHLRSNYTIESMYRPYGFYVPVFTPGMSALDYMDGLPHTGESPFHGLMGMLITADNNIYQFSYDRYEFADKRKWNKYRMAHGEGMMRTMCYPAQLDSAVTMAVELSGSDTEAALDLLAKVFPIRRKSYVVLKIADIVAKLNVDGRTKPHHMFMPLVADPVK